MIGAALLTCFVNPDDVVWFLVHLHEDSALLDRIIFGIGTLLFLGAAALETWTNGVLLARLLFVLGLGLLLPLPGAIILISGEAFLVARLFLARDSAAPSPGPSRAFRKAASKWGFAVSMIVFTLTLQDRLVEIGGVTSFCIWLALNISQPKLPENL